MLSYKTRNREIKELTTAGSGRVLLAEVGMMINAIYNALAKGEARAAEVFRREVMAAIMLPESGVWDKHDIDCISIVQRKERGPKQ